MSSITIHISSYYLKLFYIFFGVLFSLYCIMFFQLLYPKYEECDYYYFLTKNWNWVQEAEKFTTHLRKKLEKKDIYGDSVEEVLRICTEVFNFPVYSACISVELCICLLYSCYTCTCVCRDMHLCTYAHVRVGNFRDLTDIRLIRCLSMYKYNFLSWNIRFLNTFSSDFTSSPHSFSLILPMLWK